MVKLARVQPTSGSSSPILTAQVPSSSFLSTDIQAFFTENGIPAEASHYVNLSSVASTASQFLSLGSDALKKAQGLIVKATAAGASLKDTQNGVVFSNKVSQVLSPLDGRTEVGKFLCIGMNYVDHCTEQNVPVPTVPLVFSKFGSCIVGPGDVIPRYGPTNGTLDEEPVVTSKLDYEVELGIVIGTTVPRFTSAADAHNFIGGYTVIHDVSARDLQLEANGGQWLLGKAGDGYAPMGPTLVTLDEFVKDGEADEFAGAGDLRIECRLKHSGSDEMKTVQSSSTKQMVFSTPQIISYLSKFMTLYPGDVIATGTPPGVGCFRKPDPLWLLDGDEVECEIEGIGVLKNVVVERVDAPAAADTNVEPETTSAATVAPSMIGNPNAESDSKLPQQQRLKNTVGIVTGAARGLGYGIALRLALEGAKSVILIDMNQDELDSAVSQLEKELQELGVESLGPIFHGVACDVTDTEQVAESFRHIATNLSPTHRIDILVQSAGVVGQTNIRTHEVQPSNFDFVMNVNVKGIFNGCRAVLPYMLQQSFGRIINIASVAGKEGNAGMLAYSTSKAAVIGLTKTVGKEYAENNITCNAIAPAVIRTQMVADMPEQQVTYMTDKIPMKRCGKVEEIAAMVSYIASEEAAFTTGFCFDATGGRSTY
jgi:2-keto-4-pentenoate hydratase/2-oxohepta-3-ene-1,7-dioic acid hydratase in catechol pathway/NAD(P)-dependent dehydrogenase (short-subunit alcohol dehydrogenase family)